VEFAKASFPKGMSLEEMRVAVDVGNGAAYKSTPCVLRELGAEVAVAHNHPNGININDGCGSMHPEEIQRSVEISGADVGISHDGDADRVLLCDEDGEIVDGDEILAIAALDLLETGRLEQNTVVATVMSNFGLDEALATRGGKNSIWVANKAVTLFFVTSPRQATASLPRSRFYGSCTRPASH
jgi:phosphoglucosamine mutase